MDILCSTYYLVVDLYIRNWWLFHCTPTGGCFIAHQLVAVSLHTYCLHPNSISTYVVRLGQIESHFINFPPIMEEFWSGHIRLPSTYALYVQYVHLFVSQIRIWDHWTRFLLPERCCCIAGARSYSVRCTEVDVKGQLFKFFPIKGIHVGGH